MSGQLPPGKIGFPQATGASYQPVAQFNQFAPQQPPTNDPNRAQSQSPPSGNPSQPYALPQNIPSVNGHISSLANRKSPESAASISAFRPYAEMRGAVQSSNAASTQPATYSTQRTTQSTTSPYITQPTTYSSPSPYINQPATYSTQAVPFGNQPVSYSNQSTPYSTQQSSPAHSHQKQSQLPATLPQALNQMSLGFSVSGHSTRPIPPYARNIGPPNPSVTSLNPSLGPPTALSSTPNIGPNPSTTVFPPNIRPNASPASLPPSMPPPIPSTAPRMGPPTTYSQMTPTPPASQMFPNQPLPPLMPVNPSGVQPFLLTNPSLPPPGQYPPSFAASKPHGAPPTSSSSFLPTASRQPGSEYQQPPPTYHQQPPMTNHFPAPSDRGPPSQFPGSTQPRSLSDYLDLSTVRNPIAIYGIGEIQYSLPQNVNAPEVRCDPAVFRCTLNAIPQTEELLAKSRLPLALTLQPFRDIKQLNVIRAQTIVRCRFCRTYINPFVHLPDNRRWKCNLCYKANELPEDFLYDPATRSFQDASMRPELQHATVEFIAPSEYMLRPPQPSVYLFILDISAAAIRSGYLYSMCEQMLISLDQMPGDERSLMAFMAVDSSMHFFQFYNEKRPPRELVIDDVEEGFLPANAGLLVNLPDFKESIRLLLSRLPEMYSSNVSNSQNCLGSALLIAKELISETGGRVTVFQCSLPTIGPGALKSREDPNERAGTEADLSPATDFYKRLSLECTAIQIGIDLFAFNKEFVDIATLSEMAKFSSGSVYRFPSFDVNDDPQERRRFERTFTRYLTRKIGFEAVLRIRCSRGLAVSAFYGNFFVRSTDLLSMANVNPDSAVGVQLNYEEKLTSSTACFQAALLYTSSKGDRRIRVHTLCLPTASELSPVFGSLDCRLTVAKGFIRGSKLRAMVSMLAKLGGEKAMAGSPLADCREAIVNAAVDAFSAFSKTAGRTGVLSAKGGHLKFLPVMCLALLKHNAFLAGKSVRLDDRASAMLSLRSYPLEYIFTDVYPLLFRLNEVPQLGPDEELHSLPLSWEYIHRDGVYLLIAGYTVLIYVAASSDTNFVQSLFGCKYQQIEPESWKEQPNELSEKVHLYVSGLISRYHILASPHVIREDSPCRHMFVSRFVDDRTESAYSYVEFIQHIKKEIGH